MTLIKSISSLGRINNSSSISSSNSNLNVSIHADSDSSVSQYSDNKVSVNVAAIKIGEAAVIVLGLIGALLF